MYIRMQGIERSGYIRPSLHENGVKKVHTTDGLTVAHECLFWNLDFEPTCLSFVDFVTEVCITSRKLNSSRIPTTREIKKLKA